MSKDVASPDGSALSDGLGAGSGARHLASDDPALPFEELLERERISVVWNGHFWSAEMGDYAFNEYRGPFDPPFGSGATPREAALVCLKAAKQPADVGSA